MVALQAREASRSARRGRGDKQRGRGCSSTTPARHVISSRRAAQRSYVRNRAFWSGEWPMRPHTHAGKAGGNARANARRDKCKRGASGAYRAPVAETGGFLRDYPHMSHAVQRV